MEDGRTRRKDGQSLNDSFNTQNLTEEERAFQRMHRILLEHQEYLRRHTLSGGVGLYPHLFEESVDYSIDDLSLDGGLNATAPFDSEPDSSYIASLLGHEVSPDEIGEEGATLWEHDLKEWGTEIERFAEQQPDFWYFLKGLLQAKNRQIARLQANAYAARNALYRHTQNMQHLSKEGEKVAKGQSAKGHPQIEHLESQMDELLLQATSWTNSKTYSTQPTKKHQNEKEKGSQPEVEDKLERLSNAMAKWAKEWAVLQEQAREGAVKLKVEEMKVRELQLKLEQLHNFINNLENELEEERRSKEKLRNKLQTKLESYRYQLEVSRDNLSHPAGSDNESAATDNLGRVQSLEGLLLEQSHVMEQLKHELLQYQKTARGLQQKLQRKKHTLHKYKQEVTIYKKETQGLEEKIERLEARQHQIQQGSGGKASHVQIQESQDYEPILEFEGRFCIQKKQDSTSGHSAKRKVHPKFVASDSEADEPVTMKVTNMSPQLKSGLFAMSKQ